jgi:hypothetical protein
LTAKKYPSHPLEDAMRIANLADHSPKPSSPLAEKLAFVLVKAGACEVY